MNFAVLVFPGTWSERDCQYVLAHEMGQRADLIWHRESNLDAYDAVVIPGGFSYGDHLRTGAIARFSPVMEAVQRHADAGKPVIGICNGFQILCESGLLPGALIRNRRLRFVCRCVHVRVETTVTPVTLDLVPGEVLDIPVKHGEGQFVADDEELRRIEGEGLVVFRYCAADGTTGDDASNPNGSANSIAGVRNQAGNVVGLMPHPEHAVDPDVGPTGGQPLFASLLTRASARV